MPTKEQFVAAARTLVGAKFAHQGRSREEGLDCIGVPISAAMLVLPAKDVPQIMGYARFPDGITFMSHCRELLIEVPRYGVGCLVAMAFTGFPTHMGIIGDCSYATEHYTLIHAYAPSRKVVEHRIDDIWHNRIVASFRLPGIVY
jgi:hypothetical protein